MDKKNFTIKGYSKFYRSLIRYYHGFNVNDALELTYSVYSGVLKTHNSKQKDNVKPIINKADFIAAVKNYETTPYRTEIQLYRSMEAIIFGIEVKIIAIEDVSAVISLTRMMDEIELRFFNSFSMEIDYQQTIYSKCVRNLVPRADEPGLCLLRDIEYATTCKIYYGGI